MKYLEEIDAESAKERFMGNEAMYKKFLFQLPEKNMLDDLDKRLEENNVEEAFKVAHTLKGLAGNLSLNRLMQVTSEVVEVLRAGNMPEDAAIEKLKASYEDALVAIEEVKGGVTLF